MTEDKINLLLVDDRPENLLALEAILDSPHYHLIKAVSGEDALKCLLKEDFAVILLDVQMPDLDGFETAELIKKRDQSKHIPIIFLTALSQDEEHIFKGYSVGAVDYILKPYNIDVLKSKVAVFVDLYKKSRQLVQEQKARTEAEESSRIKSEFVSNVSHELRTPLNAILGYTALLLDGTFTPIDENLKTPLEGIYRNANDLLKLVNNILDLSKLEAGKLSVFLEELDLSVLVEEVSKTMKLFIENKSLELHRNQIDDLPPIVSDRVKIKQILTNLICNAIKFTQRGSIRITGRNRPEKGGVEIAIQDTGVGIRAEELDKIFTAFHQADASYTREYGGVGLGLKIVKDLLRLLKGEIAVESLYGEGSIFTIFLPYR